MNFGEELNNYMKMLGCNINDICKETEISYSLIHRYINNKRTPKVDSENFNKVVDAIYQISVRNNVDLSRDNIYETLKKAIISNDIIDFDLFVENFNLLQDALSLSTIEISRAIGYDASFISRIKNRERKPYDIEKFINNLNNYFIYVASQSNQKKNVLIDLLNCSEEDTVNAEYFKELLTNWISSKHIEDKSNYVQNFLSKINDFDLNDYIGTDFSKIKIPTTPVIFKSSKVFFGIDGRKQAEGEFLKTTLLSKSEEPIFFYSDLPITDSGNDEYFRKKWVLAMTGILKRGLHLNMIHNLDRPLNEMLLGLENWIPIYMTGSISPYYFKTPPSNFFLTSIGVSGSVALSGECIGNNEKKSKHYLTTKKDEIEYQKQKSKYMLSKATPLMRIFKENDKVEFENFMNMERNQNIQKIKKDIFQNIDFCINEDKWIIINKENKPEIHFVIFHEKLINAIKNFLLI